MTQPLITTPIKLNVYEKLQGVRLALSKAKLKKTGRNDFAKYDYFELADFLPTITDLMTHARLCSTISFGLKRAVLCVINSEDPKEKIVFTSPMATAIIKGCNEAQNLGGAQTYIRRYLYTTAFEITENDMSDATTTETGKPIATPAKQNVTQGNNSVTNKQQSVTLRNTNDLKCPKCSKLLVPKPNKKTGNEFLACPGFPDCKYIHKPTTPHSVQEMPPNENEPPPYDEDVPF